MINCCFYSELIVQLTSFPFRDKTIRPYLTLVAAVRYMINHLDSQARQSSSLIKLRKLLFGATGASIYANNEGVDALSAQHFAQEYGMLWIPSGNLVALPYQGVGLRSIYFLRDVDLTSSLGFPGDDLHDVVSRFVDDPSKFDVLN